MDGQKAFTVYQIKLACIHFNAKLCKKDKSHTRLDEIFPPTPHFVRIYKTKIKTKSNRENGICPAISSTRLDVVIHLRCHPS